MKWTRDRPAEPGWYWYQDDLFMREPIVLQVVWVVCYADCNTEDVGKLIPGASLGSGPVGLGGFPGWWAGPIEAPRGEADDVDCEEKPVEPGWYWASSPVYETRVIIEVYYIDSDEYNRRWGW